MTRLQFELFKKQLTALTPQQLQALRVEINSNLKCAEENLVTDEELNLISSLFS